MPKFDSFSKNQRAATIHDVAKQAGVSIATVSRVLNGSSTVDPQLAERVHATMILLNYQPSRAARMLAGSRSSLLGLLVTDIQNPFYMDLMRGVEVVAREHGYLLIIGNTGEDVRQEARYCEVLVAEPVAGAIFVPTQGHPPGLELFKAHHIPVVAVDRRINDRTIDTILIDNVDAAKEVVTHLITNGYKRIGIISGPKVTTNAEERARGYRLALQEAGLPLDPQLEQRGSLMSEETGEQLTNTLLDLNVEALFTTNNRLTVGALRALYKRHKRIPEDIALAGFDEMYWSVPHLVPITTIVQSAYELGYTAGKRLLERIQKPDTPRQEIFLQYQLEVHESSLSRISPGKNHELIVGEQDKSEGSSR